VSGLRAISGLVTIDDREVYSLFAASKVITGWALLSSSEYELMLSVRAGADRLTALLWVIVDTMARPEHRRTVRINLARDHGDDRNVLHSCSTVAEAVQLIEEALRGPEEERCESGSAPTTAA
jgi:hypothetical protein